MQEIYEMMREMVADSENVNKSIETQTEPKKKGRPRAEWRHNEDGTYNTAPLDPKYQLKYWYEHFRKPYECDVCGKTLKCCGSGVLKHKRSMHCQLAKLKAEKLAEQTSNN